MMEKTNTTVVPGVQEVRRKTEYSISEQYDAMVTQENDIREAIRETQPIIGKKVSRWGHRKMRYAYRNEILRTT